MHRQTEQSEPIRCSFMTFASKPLRWRRGSSRLERSLAPSVPNIIRADPTVSWCQTHTSVPLHAASAHRQDSMNVLLSA